MNGAFLDRPSSRTVRTQTLTVADATSAWGTDLEVTPGLALIVETPFSASRWATPHASPCPSGRVVPELAILNRATLRASWQPDPLWTVGASGTFTWGEYSQLAPATTPGGAGPPPSTLDPVRSFETYPYVGIDTLLTVQRTLSPRSRVRLGGGYFDVGGVGSLGQANQPRTWGPVAEAAFAWEASRASTLTTGATYQRMVLPG